MTTNFKKYKIVGEFAGYGTKIIDQETGAEVRQVKKVVWTHEAGKAPTCDIQLVGVAIEAVGADISSVDQTDPYRRRKGLEHATLWQRLKYHVQRCFGRDPLQASCEVKG